MTDQRDGSAGPDAPAYPDPFDGPEWSAGGTSVPPGTPPPVRRRRRVSRRRLRRRRRYGWVMIIVGGAIVLTGAWLLVTGLLARDQLQAVRNDVHQLRTEISAGNLGAARATAHAMSGHAHRAHELTTGPAWAVAAVLPGGEPLRTARAITAQADALGHDVLPQLVAASTQLDPKTLRRPDGSIDLARISAATPTLDRAQSHMSAAIAAIAAQPPHTWLGTIDSARRALLAQLTSLQHTLHSADLAAHIAPALLGQDGPKRYFVAFQNDAEARGTGGVAGAFAILQADHGKISLEKFESDSLLPVTATGLDFGPGYDHLFAGAKTTSLYANSNLSPNFPYAAQVWLAMWRKHSGQQLDGAIALDPTVLSYLLQASGPARLPDGSQVSASNVVALTESQIYAKFPTPADNAARKQYLLDIARAASSKILDGHASTTQLVKALGRAAGQRRLLIYSSTPSVQADIAQTSMSGAVPRTDAPYVGLSIVNDGGNKLDYYLDRSLTWQRTGCGSVRDVTVTVRLTNDAPASGLSYYVTARSDRHGYPVKPGDNRLEVSYYATHGATMDSIDLDGKPYTAAAGTDLGHPVFRADVELPRGATRTLVLHLREPVGTGAPIVLRQPLVRPLKVTLEQAACR